MPEGLPAPPAAIRPRTALAWCVVAAVVGLVLLMHSLAPDPKEQEFALEFMTQQVQVQYGTRDLVGSLGGTAAEGASTAALYDQLAATFARGPVPQRQRFSAVAADLSGPAAALGLLDETERLLRERGIPLEGRALRIQGSLRAIYSGGAVPEAERAELREELGWFGELALAPEGSPGRAEVIAPARRVASRQLAVVLALLAALGAGVIAAVVFWLSVVRREGTFFLLGPGAAPHGIYAETFAAWMALFVLVSLGAGLLVRFAGLEDWALGVEGGAVLLTLGALAWPVRRGIPFATVRDDLGLRLPANPGKEILAGFACWLSSLPLMAAGLAVVVALSLVAGMFVPEDDPLAPSRMASHPIMGEVAKEGRWLLVLLLAAGVAPVVEETFFRGVLYRHLRDATGTRGRLASVAISAAVSGVVFAVIHPQGLLAVPLLAAVSWGLVQAREWRGSLLAPMAAHSLHNALVTGFLYLQFGSG